MRTACLLLVLFALLAGCRSGRNYRSINRTSLEFLKDTAGQSRRLRKKNLRQALAFRDRRAYIRRQRREGRAFAWNALWKDMWKDAGKMVRNVAAEFHNEDFAKNTRFGFLDSGE